MNDLIPLLPDWFDDYTKPGVLASALYEFLELNPTNFARWTQKNIVNNPYATEHEDWEGFLPNDENRPAIDLGGRPTQDYVVSIRFAKKLAMSTRSAKGNEAQEYFLACEGLAKFVQAQEEELAALRA